MTTWYATEQFASADHTQRIQQRRNASASAARTTQQPTTWWWTALRQLWRRRPAQLPAPEPTASR